MLSDTSPSQHVTHKHYVKIVGSRFEFLDGTAAHAYKFSVNSFQYVDVSTPPMIRFSYDLSPLQVRVRQYRQPLYHFITSLCAIMGGVFTVLGIIDSVVYYLMKANKRD